EGQVHGATAHGIGAALHESFVYDEDSGQLLSHNFYDYHAATALDVPLVITGEIECPSPRTPNGAKGMGQGAAPPLPPLCPATRGAAGAGGAAVPDPHRRAGRGGRVRRGGGGGGGGARQGGVPPG